MSETPMLPDIVDRLLTDYEGDRDFDRRLREEASREIEALRTRLRELERAVSLVVETADGCRSDRVTVAEFASRMVGPVGVCRATLGRIA